MHTIPNYPFGKVANRSVIRVFLPHMYKMHETRAIPTQDLELIYNECLRPLVREHMHNMASHWPASYASALSLYRDGHGRIHQGSLDVPAHILDTFGKAYLRKLAQLRPYFRQAYFVHEFRGWKGATVHDPFHALDRQLALENLTNILRMDKIDPDFWFIDIGLEFGTPNHVVTWRDSGHENVLAHCLPSVEPNQINDIVDKSTFYVDKMMHLKDLSGFRYAPGIRGRADNVQYIQAYTTEKAMSYQLHAGLFSPLHPKSLLTTENIKGLITKIEEMSKILFDCTADGDQNRYPQEGCARLEIRVSISKALTALLTVPVRILNYSLVALPATSWW